MQLTADEQKLLERFVLVDVNRVCPDCGNDIQKKDVIDPDGTIFVTLSCVACAYEIARAKEPD